MLGIEAPGYIKSDRGQSCWRIAAANLARQRPRINLGARSAVCSVCSTLLMALPQLPKLSLDVLPPALGGSAASRSGIDGDGPALLSLANLALCYATRSQVNQLTPVELALLRALEAPPGD
jgi:hypothetical protein